jgi:hypothetical protein
MKKILFLFILFSLQSCVTNYYTATVNTDTALYSSQDAGNPTLHIVPAGSAVYVNTKKSRKNYYKIKYGSHTGWAYNPSYTLSTTRATTSSSNYTTPSSSGNTVQVNGYYRKDGTYVRPHTRSAPKRK